MENKYIALTASYNAEDVLKKFFNRMKRLDPAPSQHVFVTNNCKDKTDSMIDKYIAWLEANGRSGKRITYSLPDKFPKIMSEPYIGIALARQRLLREARIVLSEDESFTHAIFIDDDVFPDDVDAIARTAQHNKPIVGGTYYRYFPEGRFVSSKWIDVLSGKRILRSAPRGPIDQPWTTSAGWLLLNREVVLNMDLNFYPIYKPSYKDTSEDFGYCLKARSLGYGIWLDATATLSHFIRQRNRPWTRKSDNLKEYIPFQFSKDYKQSKATRKVQKKMAKKRARKRRKQAQQSARTGPIGGI